MRDSPADGRNAAVDSEADSLFQDDRRSHDEKSLAFLGLIARTSNALASATIVFWRFHACAHMRTFGKMPSENANSQKKNQFPFGSIQVHIFSILHLSLEKTEDDEEHTSDRQAFA